MAQYSLKLAHLYGDLLNTYGDIGNILALKYYAQLMDIDLFPEVVSIEEDFNADNYDIAFFGGGQDFEQQVVSEDIPKKATEIKRFIEENKPMLAICGGYQLLGHYYIDANGQKVKGVGALDHYTLSQNHHRFIGDIQIKNDDLNVELHGFENHQGRTFIGKDEKPLGTVEEGYGNNGEDKTEGAVYKHVYCSYFHGPILTRNGALAKEMLLQALKNRYPAANLSKQEALKVKPTF